MTQLIALQTKVPTFDLQQTLRGGQEVQAGELKLQAARNAAMLDDANTRAELGKTNALERYRFRREKGMGGAEKELAGFPELQKQLDDAFSGMTPDEFAAAKERAFVFGEAARKVGMFSPGTPERAEMWDRVIRDLYDAGFLDKETAEASIRGGPNDLIIDQALTVEEYVKKHAGPKREKVSTGKAGKADTSDGMGEAEEGRRLRAIETRLSKMRDNGAPEDEIAAEEKRLRKIYELEPTSTNRAKDRNTTQFDLMTDPNAPLVKGGKKTAPAAGKPGATRDNPAKITSQADYDALPPGYYFINPADGAKMRKPVTNGG